MPEVYETVESKLESIVDFAGLAGTIETLAQICYEKAGHMVASYGADADSRAWEKAAVMIGKLATRVSEQTGL